MTIAMSSMKTVKIIDWQTKEQQKLPRFGQGSYMRLLIQQGYDIVSLLKCLEMLKLKFIELVLVFMLYTTLSLAHLILNAFSLTFLQSPLSKC